MSVFKELKRWKGNILKYYYESIDKDELIAKELRLRSMVDFLNKNSKNEYVVKTFLRKIRHYPNLEPGYQDDYRLDIFIIKK